MSTTQTTIGPARVKGLDTGYSEQDTRWTTGYFAKSKTFQHRNIHKYTSNFPDGNNHNLTDHILIDRQYSSILNVRSFTGDDCDTVHYPVVAKVREKLEVCKRAAQKFHVERFNFRKLNELEVRRQYQFKISKRSAGLDKLNDSEEINRAWENLRGNFKNSAKEILGLHKLKQHIPWHN